jgi:sec-independent protein translocase protein TatC
MLNFSAHFYELKLKIYYYCLSLLISFCTSYFFAPNLINILSCPFLKFVQTDDSDFIFTSIFEVFTTYYELALYSCCFLNIPFGLYSILNFVKSGLFKYEKKILFFFLKFFICSVFLSSLFTYYIIFPFLLFFLLNLDLITDTNFVFVKMETKIYDYVIFLCKSLFFYCFFIFQIPLLFYILVYFKQPTFQYMINNRRFLILSSLIVGCLFSSPDLSSLLIISTPFLLFFEIFIFLIILKRNYKDINSFILESCLNGKRRVC